MQHADYAAAACWCASHIVIWQVNQDCAADDISPVRPVPQHRSHCDVIEASVACSPHGCTLYSAKDVVRVKPLHNFVFDVPSGDMCTVKRSQPESGTSQQQPDSDAEDLAANASVLSAPVHKDDRPAAKVGHLQCLLCRCSHDLDVCITDLGSEP